MASNGSKAKLTDQQKMILAGSRTDREFEQRKKHLFPPPAVVALDDAPLSEKFLVQLAHAFLENPDFWRPILWTVLKGNKS